MTAFTIKSPSFKILYGFFYGALIAAAYLYVRLNDASGGLGLFAVSAGVCFFLHLVLFPKSIAMGLKNKTAIVRGLLFGTTQVLIFKAQAEGFTTTALVSATMGSVFGVIFGRILLKEKLKGVSVLAAVFCFTAVFIDPSLILKSYWGVIAGLIQGVAWVLVRKLMLEEIPIKEGVSIGFLVASLVSFLGFYAFGWKSSELLFPLRHIVVVVFFALTIQYAFFYLYKLLDSQRASLLTLSRIPWVIGVEGALFGALISTNKVLSAILIMVGTLILILESKLTEYFVLNKPPKERA